MINFLYQSNVKQTIAIFSYGYSQLKKYRSYLISDQTLMINASCYHYQANRHICIAHEYFIDTSFLIIVRCFYVYHSWPSLVDYVIVHDHNFTSCNNILIFMFYVRVCGDIIYLLLSSEPRAQCNDYYFEIE